MRTSLLRLALFLEKNSVALTAAMVLGSLVGAVVAGADVLMGVLAAALAFAAGVCVGLILPDLLFHVLVPGERPERVVVRGGHDPHPEERVSEDLGQRRGET